MSAFVVDHETVNRIVTYVIRDHQNLRRIFEPMGYDVIDDPDALGNDLLAMNQDAVMQCYPDCDATNLPGPVDPPAYRYIPVPSPLVPINKIQVYKSLGCLIYQCREGDVPERDLFKALMKLERIVAYQIISHIPAYEQAVWG